MIYGLFNSHEPIAFNFIAGMALPLADSADAYIFIGVLVVAAVVLGLVALGIYNSVNPLSHKLHEAEANIEVSMQKRINLANALLDVASRYAKHEALVHLRVSADRRGSGFYQQSGKAIAFVTQLAATFPALKADTGYLRLMDDLRMLEGELQTRYEGYNALAREYNALRTSFPAILFVEMLGFKKATYLDPSLWHPR